MRNKKKILIWIALIVIFLLLNVFQSEARGFFYNFSSPIQETFWKAGKSTSNFFWGILASGSLKERNDYLELKNQELFSQILSFQEIEEENSFLREAISAGLDKKYSFSFAKITGKEDQILLINKGTEDGILKDMPVITEEEVLVGRIIESYGNFSKVMLITNKDSSFDAKILKEDNELTEQDLILGVAKGTEKSLLIDLIPKEKEVKRGDLVGTSSKSGLFPGGLLVGWVERVRENDASTFKQADVKIAFDYLKSERLLIITDFND